MSTRALEGFSSAAAANPRAFKSWTLPNLGQGGLCRRANLMAAISASEPWERLAMVRCLTLPYSRDDSRSKYRRQVLPPWVEKAASIYLVVTIR